jgi:hypothetical protein
MKTNGTEAPVFDFMPPTEADEVLSRVHTEEAKQFKRMAPSVPHCDCQDKREVGAMRPTNVDRDGCCTFCGNFAFMKPIGTRTNQHGTTTMYNRGCKCEQCRTAHNAKQAGRRNKEST